MGTAPHTDIFQGMSPLSAPLLGLESCPEPPPSQTRHLQTQGAGSEMGDPLDQAMARATGKVILLSSSLKRQTLKGAEASRRNVNSQQNPTSPRWRHGHGLGPGRQRKPKTLWEDACPSTGSRTSFPEPCCTKHGDIPGCSLLPPAPPQRVTEETAPRPPAQEAGSPGGTSTN